MKTYRLRALYAVNRPDCKYSEARYQLVVDYYLMAYGLRAIKANKEFNAIEYEIDFESDEALTAFEIALVKCFKDIHKKAVYKFEPKDPKDCDPAIKAIQNGW